MPEPIEARMQFIIEQQAQFAVGIQLLKERPDRSQQMIDANREMIRQLVDVTMSLARHAQETDRRLKEVDERLGARIEQIAEAGAHTDRRLDALIDDVDKLVRRNGG